MSFYDSMILNENTYFGFFFFWEKEGHNQKVIAIYISNEIEERETHTRARCRISSGGFQRKLVHGNASSSWISRLLSRRNNSLYLCHPPILPTLLFSTTPYFISFSLLFTSLLPPFFSNSYYSSRIIFFLFFLFFFSLLYPCKHIERTRPKEEIIAFWHRGIASISRYCSRRSRLLHFITAELRCCCKSASFKKAWYCTRIIMTGCVLYFQKRGGVEGGKRANISRLPGIEGKRW